MQGVFAIQLTDVKGINYVYFLTNNLRRSIS